MSNTCGWKILCLILGLAVGGCSSPNRESSLAEVSTLVSRIATEKNEEKSADLLEELGDLRPDCMPHLLAIAKDRNHVGSLTALRYLDWEDRAEKQKPYREFLLETLSDDDPKRRAESLFMMYCRQWPEAPDERLLAILRPRKDKPDPFPDSESEVAFPKRSKMSGAIWKRLPWALAGISPEAAGIADKVATMYAEGGHDQDRVAWALHQVKPDHPLVLDHLKKSLVKEEKLNVHNDLILEALDSRQFAEIFEEYVAFAEKKIREPEGPNGFFLKTLSDYHQPARLDAKKRTRLAKLMAEVLDRTEDSNCCGNACRVLLRLGEESAVALPGLRKILRDPKAILSKKGVFKGYYALHAVAKLGPKAAKALPEVRKLIGQRGYGALAIAVMIRISPADTKKGLEMLRKLLQNDRGRALGAAAYFGKTAAPLRDIIEPIARNAEDQYRGIARVAMATSGEAKPIVAEFIAQLRSEDMYRRNVACEALAFLQKYAGDAVPVLEKMIIEKMIISEDPGPAAICAGAIYEITGRRVSSMIYCFNIPPGGCPW
jgi:hypothetical protein